MPRARLLLLPLIVLALAAPGAAAKVPSTKNVFVQATVAPNSAAVLTVPCPPGWAAIWGDPEDELLSTVTVSSFHKDLGSAPIPQRDGWRFVLRNYSGSADPFKGGVKCAAIPSGRKPNDVVDRLISAAKSPSVVADRGQFRSVDAACPSGFRAISWGFRQSRPGPPAEDPPTKGTEIDLDTVRLVGSSLGVLFENAGTRKLEAQFQAVCIDMAMRIPGGLLDIDLATRFSSNTSPGFGVVQVQCRPGTGIATAPQIDVPADFDVGRMISQPARFARYTYANQSGNPATAHGSTRCLTYRVRG